MDFWLFIFLFALFHGVLGSINYDFENTLGHIHIDTADDVQVTGAQNLIVRLLGEDAQFFKVNIDTSTRINGKETFKVRKIHGNKVEINGSSGVAVAWGLQYYLKTYCGCHISWEGSQLKLPKVLPEVNDIVTANDRYYQNVCTAGYSSTWWKWDKWEKNIDWMALNGINLALAFHAQEAIWERVYLKFNLTKLEIAEHFGGPAFLPWSRMGNIRGWGGPLSNSWHNHTIRLQHAIIKRMRELGIIPVLPAFAGHIPRALLRIFPDANVTKVNQWNDFGDDYCCPYALEPNDPLFQIVGQEFLKTYIEEFGTNNIYNCDSFNENDPNRGDLRYLEETGKAIFLSMITVDPRAIWLMQGWLFVHSSHYWTKDRVKAFVTSVPIGKMIILDLQSEQFPQYEAFDFYYGQPFIWCMLHNFGGTLGMFGSAGIINRRVFEARQMNGSTMIGTGLAPEGINQNYVIYELMNEMAYRKEPVHLDDWFSNYAARRYGVMDETIETAWKILGSTIYNFNGTQRIRGQYVITRRPSLTIKPWYWYDLNKFFNSWEKFVNLENSSVKNSDLFQHDLVDITRQALQVSADFIYNDIVASVQEFNVTKFRTSSSKLLEIFDDLEEILSSNKDYLLGSWLEDAKAIADPNDQIALQNYEMNARNQITLWGPNGEIVDYANKQWSGVVQDYFRARWSIFLKELENSIINNRQPNVHESNRLIFNNVELPFTYSRTLYPTETTGDSIKIASKIYNKWRKLWK